MKGIKKSEKKLNRTQIADSEIEELSTMIKELTPPNGYYYLKNEQEEEIKNSYPGDLKWKNIKLNFKDLPLSKRTLRGLSENRFIKMTPIQRSSIIHSLAGKNIIGASKTGSGKTLCFIIPILELLYHNKWSSLDGLGALLILPTRELAIQVFEVFKLVGKYHDFSCGLVIGGNDVEHEKERLYKMNILIGTPGRLLQHITETPYFNTNNLQILTIDEVDRILDDGFESALNEIFSYLPNTRQTLLFSATLTRSLKRLAKVNMKTAEYINLNNTDMIIGDDLDKITSADQIGLLNVNGENKQDKPRTISITPINLNQYFTLIQTHEKIDILYSFLNNHKTSKCLIFLNSCKQVRFYYEVFKKLKLGMIFLELHGKQKQNKRTTVFYSFLQKKNTVLFATDVASRGLDFTHVDWVVQVDCPEDIQTYIHRVGRTARYKSQGNSLLFVNSKEQKFIEKLKEKNMLIKGIKINQSKLINLQPIIRSLLSDNSELVHLAQKAISSYIKSIYLQNDKDIFDINSINLEQLALSYGIVNMPEMKIVKTSQNHLKNQERIVNDEEDNLEPVEPAFDKKKSKLQKLKEKIKLKKMQKLGNLSNLVECTEVDEFLTEKRRNDDEILQEESKPKGKKRKIENVEDSNGLIEHNEQNDFYEKIKKKLAKNEMNDKANEKLRIFEKHKNDRLKRKMHDYEKHGLNDEEQDDNSDENNDNDNDNDNEIALSEEEYQDKNNKPIKTKDKSSNRNSNIKKVKINLKNSTLEEKEKAALEILGNTNSFFT